jgi:hypothetical protein
LSGASPCSRSLSWSTMKVEDQPCKRQMSPLKKLN